MTTVTPHRRLLISIPLLCAVALLSAAAARTPTPRPPSLGRHSAHVFQPRALARNLTSGTEKTSAESRAARQNPPMRAARVRQLPSLASPESLPRISVTWENAPIEGVIDAFATFSHRRITTAPNVGGLVTATVVGQPWAEALESIMARHGMRVEFRADGSIYISPRQESEPRSRERNQTVQVSRAVSGTVDDAQTGAPIRDARIDVAGVQLINAPNEAWSDERGRFALRVPDGEVWLDASRSGYEFRRVTLAPGDSVAVFHGYKTGDCSPSDTARVNRKQIKDIEGGPVFVIDGVVVNDSKSHRCPYEPGRLLFKVF
jgi:hypothetical protein